MISNQKHNQLLPGQPLSQAVVSNQKPQSTVTWATTVVQPGRNNRTRKPKIKITKIVHSLPIINNPKQQCIPVGYGPSVAVAISRGGVCRGGVHPERNACPGGVCTSLLVDRILGTRLWKHYLSATTAADGNKEMYNNCFATKTKTLAVIEPRTWNLLNSHLYHTWKRCRLRAVHTDRKRKVSKKKRQT